VVAAVSKSSISLWVRDVTVPVRPYDPERVALIRERRWGPTLRRREAERRATKEAAAGLAGELSDRDLLLLGAVAYWCEGAKDKPYQRREIVQFTNTDADLIRLMLSCLTLLGVQCEDITFRVAIHETADVVAAEDFWRKAIGVPDPVFARATIKRHNPRTNRRRTADDYHGCLVMQVRGSADIYRRLEGLWHGIVRGVAPG
jgi:hypothetical protein